MATPSVPTAGRRAFASALPPRSETGPGSRSESSVPPGGAGRAPIAIGVAGEQAVKVKVQQAAAQPARRCELKERFQLGEDALVRFCEVY